MKRSGRPALAMSWTVAVGIAISAAPLGMVMGAGPAAADDGPGDAVERGAEGTAAPRASDPRRLERPSRGGRAPARGGWPHEDAPAIAHPDGITSEHPGWECHWPKWDPVITPIAGLGVGGGGRGLVLVAPAGVAAPLIASPPVSGPATERISTGVTREEPEAVAPPAAPAIAPLAGPPPTAPAPLSPPGSAGGPPAAPPVTPPPVTAAAQSAAAQPNPILLGYPAYLQSASVGEITALAILGSAGLMALAGAGGVVGYRQAKTGFALRAAGTARFLS